MAVFAFFGEAVYVAKGFFCRGAIKTGLCVSKTGYFVVKKPGRPIIPDRWSCSPIVQNDQIPQSGFANYVVRF
jgi:hypothetical protein